MPKGTNVTKADVKVAKIVIPGQGTTPISEGPKTSKNLGIKEVLNKLSHFSQTVRSDGLNGLKELLVTDSSDNLVASNLALILTSLIPTTQDKERKLRRLAISLFPLVLTKISSSLLSPLHALLSAHLCCSLTHIDQRIQQDGLSLLDTLLENAPDFVSLNYNSILPNCLDQISNKRASESGPHVSDKSTETMTALQWRILVLSRVDKVLEVVVKKNQKTDENAYVTSIMLDFSPGSHVPKLEIKNPPPFTLSAISSTSSENLDLHNFDLLMPLLVETWVEARANVGKAKKSSLTSEISDLLLSEVNIIDKLLTLALDGANTEQNLSIIQKKFLPDIKQHFLAYLPYVSHGKSADQANTLLCCIYLRIGESIDEDFLNNAVKVVANRNITDLSRIRLAKSILEKKKLSLEYRNLTLSSLIDMAEQTVEMDKALIFEILLDQSRRYCTDGLNDWAKGLVENLIKIECSSNMEIHLKTVLELTKSCNKAARRSFGEIMEKIKEVIILKEQFKENQESLLKTLSFILYHCDASYDV